MNRAERIEGNRVSDHGHIRASKPANRIPQGERAVRIVQSENTNMQIETFGQLVRRSVQVGIDPAVQK